MTSAGLLFNPALAEVVQRGNPLIEHLAVIPDRCWTDHGVGHAHRFELLRAPIDLIEQACAAHPLVLHGIGLSICSAELFDREYVEQLARWRERWGCAWVSEHLSFSRVGGEHETNAALALACPYDNELLELLVPRVREAQRCLGVPLLLENNVNYLRWADEDYGEPQFLNALVAESGCGLLLDLHNLYVNCRNHGLDARAWIDQLQMDAVIEMHVAGGDEMLGLYTDSHAGPVQPETWPLLDHALAAAPHCRSVTFEFHETTWPMLHEAGVSAELQTVRAAIERRHGAG